MFPYSQSPLSLHFQCFGPLPANVTTENSSRAVLNQLPSSCPRIAAQPRSSQCDSTGKQTETKKRFSLDSSLDQKRWTTSNLATQLSSSPTNVHFTHIQPQSALPRPKLVPIFKNKSHTRHVNVTEMLAAKQQQGLEGQKLKTVIRPLSSTCLSSPPAPERMTLPFSKRKEKTNSGVTRNLPPLPLVQTQPQIIPKIPSNGGVSKLCKQAAICPVPTTCWISYQVHYIHYIQYVQLFEIMKYNTI